MVAHIVSGVVVQRLLGRIFKGRVRIVGDGLVRDRAEDGCWEADPRHGTQVAAKKKGGHRHWPDSLGIPAGTSQCS